MSDQFAQIAPQYDTLRPLRPADHARLRAVLDAGPHLEASDLVVDVGCGTGRLTIPLAGLTPARVIGVDPEVRMLEVARAKTAAPPGGESVANRQAAQRIEWLEGTAYHLPVAGGQAALVLMVLVVHLLKQRTRAFREAARILRGGGRLSVWTFTQDDIRDFYLNPFFPSIPRIDLARFPPHEQIAGELHRAGFSAVQTAIDRDEGEISLAEVVDRVRGRYISTLALLAPLEYRLGLQQLEEALSTDPDRTLHQRIEWAVLTATK